MKLRVALFAAASILLACTGAGAKTASTNLPLAQALLDEVILGLPDIPLQINAQLQTRDPGGRTDRRLGLEMLLDWQDTPPQARYTVRDAEGKALHFLGVTWPEGGTAEYRYMQGDPLRAAVTPVLTSPVEGLDVTWYDLSLSFLWWRGGRTTGEEEVRGRDCFVITLPAPTNLPGVAVVRLWIDPKIRIMLRAESYDPQGQRLRRMDVMGFRKINDRWFIGRIELQSFPSKHKTHLRVKSVYDRERKQFITTDEGGPEPLEVEPVVIPPPEAVPGGVE